MIILVCLWYNQEHLQKFPRQLTCLAYVTVNNRVDIPGCPLTSPHVCRDIYATQAQERARIYIHTAHTHTTKTHITNSVSISSSLVVFYIVEIQGSFYFCVMPFQPFLILCYSNWNRRSDMWFQIEGQAGYRGTEEKVMYTCFRAC